MADVFLTFFDDSSDGRLLDLQVMPQKMFSEGYSVSA